VTAVEVVTGAARVERVGPVEHAELGAAGCATRDPAGGRPTGPE
jgi:hypothetical protein